MTQQEDLESSIDHGPPPLRVLSRYTRPCVKLDHGPPPPIPPRHTRPDFRIALEKTVIEVSSDESSSDEEPSCVETCTDQQCSISSSQSVPSSTIDQDGRHSVASDTVSMAPQASSSYRANSELWSTYPSSPSKKKWYTVFRGKRVGVFDNWGEVCSLISGVPGNSHCSFRTEEEAIEAYFSAKTKGAIRLLWQPGSNDQIVYGPIEDAIL